MTKNKEEQQQQRRRTRTREKEKKKKKKKKKKKNNNNNNNNNKGFRSTVDIRSLTRSYINAFVSSLNHWFMDSSIKTHPPCCQMQSCRSTFSCPPFLDLIAVPSASFSLCDLISTLTPFPTATFTRTSCGEWFEEVLAEGRAGCGGSLERF